MKGGYSSGSRPSAARRRRRRTRMAQNLPATVCSADLAARQSRSSSFEIRLAMVFTACDSLAALHAPAQTHARDVLNLDRFRGVTQHAVGSTEAAGRRGVRIDHDFQ
jgi:hypothetical protein